MPSGQLFDELSGAPMSTDHAIARFFIPYLRAYQGWALFVDGDILVRADIRDLFAWADDQYAVQVVQHPPLLEEATKKGGQIQQAYPRKNWSSVLLFNCGHPANQLLTLEAVNGWPGRDLHAFSWLKDREIGPLPARWNYLVGVNPPQTDPAIVHFTLGTPDTKGHEADPFADEWYAAARTLGYTFDEEALRAGVTKS
jgi:lipopolysaccharide biosynthesis glycosyltransferase